MNGIRNLSDAEIDIVGGGHRHCEYGTTAGGPPGAYGDQADCNDGPPRGGDGIRAFYLAATGKNLD